MKFEYTGRHIEVTPALRSHVEEHFDRINHLFDGNSSKAHIIIEVERGKHRSEVIVNWHDQVLTATTSVEDMYKSLSQTIDKIEKQALKLKTKIIDKYHKAKKVSTIPPKQAEVKPAPVSPQIIDTKDYPVKPMTEEEAILRLVEEENQFLVFRNAANERVSVIYKRKDGNYGLIQP
ncbi:ribosome-associated translation inhibitor RaiA [soil metagenome]|jgi:putative sigma-54 modulation protein|nr:ribosome-associated translation inhibitor RaiA [Acidobacteriota bacterium]